MKKVTLNDIEFSVEFLNEVEGTYVVKVNADGEHEFFVNCQTGVDYYDIETTKLTCFNGSGGDFATSGLMFFLEDNDIYEYQELVDVIEEEAESHSTVLKTVKDLLEDKFEAVPTFEKILAGACYANNSAVVKYTLDDGRIVLVAENDNENRPEAIAEKIRVFETEEEYSKWFNESSEGHIGQWNGDCSLAYMFYIAL